MSKLKVWGGLTSTAKRLSSSNGLQARTLVCASSKREAVEMLQAVPNNRCYMSLYEFSGYWSETGNLEELRIAKERGVWTSQVLMYGGEKADWKRLWP